MFSFLERKFVESIELEDYSQEKLPSEYTDIVKPTYEIV